MMVIDTHDTYSELMARSQSGVDDAFDAHVLASVIAIAVDDARSLRRPLSESIGLEPERLACVMGAFFADAHGLTSQLSGASLIARNDDEIGVGELLIRYSTGRTQFQRDLSAIIARRALQPNHLWQDLGLANRGELSTLMNRHFRPLAMRNNADMKWKKFLYRMICRDEGYRLCTAPSCGECDDYTACFGDEAGENLLARNRRHLDMF